MILSYIQYQIDVFLFFNIIYLERNYNYIHCKMKIQNKIFLKPKYLLNL